MGVKLEDTIYRCFTTHNPTTGNVADAGSLPTCAILEDDTDVAILTPTVQKREATTGRYRVPIVVTTDNGFEVGKSYNVEIQATVGGITAATELDSFEVTTGDIDSVNVITIETVDATDAIRAVIDAALSGSGTNTVNVTVTDGVNPVVGATVVVRASAGGGVSTWAVTGSVGTCIFGLDAGTYYMQVVNISGYTHVETAVVVDEDPETVALTATAISVTPASGDSIRVYAYPYELAATVSDGATPLFTATLNYPAMTATGIIMETSVAATQHDDGYWYVDLYPLDDLTIVADHSDKELAYVFVTILGNKIQKNVNSTDTNPSNLVGDLD